MRFRPSARRTHSSSAPQRPEHGDYASSLPLRLARTARMNPMELAGVIAGHVPAGGAIEAVETAPPGFINIRLSPQWLASQVDDILKQGEAFGNVALGEGKRVQVEFVSANPVGPIHVGNGRGLALGDTIARALEAAGYEVQREYLVNDAGHADADVRGHALCSLPAALRARGGHPGGRLPGRVHGRAGAAAQGRRGRLAPQARGRALSAGGARPRRPGDGRLHQGATSRRSA